MTWAPAPTAYRSSVAVADRETILCGLALIVTWPFPAVSVTGYAGCATAAAGEVDETADWAGCVEPAELHAVRNAAAAAARASAGTPVARRTFMLESLPPERREGRRDRRSAPVVVLSCRRACRDGSPFPRGSIASSAAEGDLAGALRGPSQLRDSAGMVRRLSETGFTGFAACRAARPDRPGGCHSSTRPRVVRAPLPPGGAWPPSPPLGSFGSHAPQAAHSPG